MDFGKTVCYDAVTGSINPVGGVGKAGRIVRFADEAGDAGRVADDIWIGSKIQRQMGKRGWTDTEIKDAIDNPARTVSTRDTRHLPGPDGERTAEDKLLEKYRPVGQRSGDEILLRPADALRFVDDCEKQGFVILGMDFYAERGTAVVEVGSTEWSSITREPDAARRSQDEARTTLSRRLPGDVGFVSFVVEAPVGRSKA